MKKFFTILLYLLVACSGYSQTPFFRSIYVDGENSQVKINRLMQGHSGFIWVATDRSLIRYDGVESTVILNENSTYKSINITAIAQDEGDSIWIGMNDGRILYVKGKTVHSFLPEESLPKVPITDIAFDSNNRMWFSTYGEGIYVQDNKKLYNFNKDDGMPDNDVYDLCRDKKGNIWAATDGGLVKLGFMNQKKTIKYFDEHNGLPDNIVRSIEVDDDDNLWLGLQDNGFAFFNTKDNSFQKVFKNKEDWTYGAVKHILDFGDQLWLSSDNDGVIIYDKQYKKLTPLNKSNGLYSGRVADMIIDYEGNSWLASGNKIFRSLARILEFVRADGDKELENIQSVLCRKNGEVWYSSSSGVYSFLPGNQNVILNKSKSIGLTNESVLSMYEDYYGRIWLGTFGQGVFCYEPSTNKTFHFTEKDGLVNNNVLSVSGDKNEVWLATLGGVSKCNIDNKTAMLKYATFINYTEQDGLGNNYIYCVFVDSKKRVWFGTDGKGITMYDNGRFRNYNNKNDNIKSNVVYSVAEDAGGNIWFSTLDAGIYRFDGATFKQYGVEQGLDDYNISSLKGDKNGNLIIIHNDGLEVYNTVQNEFRLYADENGIDNLDAGLNAISTYEGKDFWIGTKNGLILFRPAKSFPEMKPRIVLKGLKILLKDAPLKSGAAFRADENFLTFNYSGIYYSNVSEITYQYKLDGYSGSNWIPTSDRSVTFPNLPPGNYTFRVRAGIKSQYDNANEAALSFSIKAPWYRRAWFLLLLTLCFAGLVYLIFRIRDNNFKQRESMERLRYEFEFDTLRSQVNPHFLFNSFNTLVNIIEEQPYNAVEYVEKLSDYFRNILTVREKQSISLDEEISLTNTYLFIQKKRYGDNFNIDWDIPFQFYHYQLPPLTLQIIIENALKHNVVSRSSPLHIHVYVEGENIVILNNISRKLQSEKGTRVGLNNIKNRIKLLSGRDMTWTDTGAEFIVKIPLIKNISAA